MAIIRDCENRAKDSLADRDRTLQEERDKSAAALKTIEELKQQIQDLKHASRSAGNDLNL